MEQIFEMLNETSFLLRILEGANMIYISNEKGDQIALSSSTPIVEYMIQYLQEDEAEILFDLSTNLQELL